MVRSLAFEERIMVAAVKVHRLHANEPDGLSRFDTFEVEREMTQFAPPAQPFPVSKPIATLDCQPSGRCWALVASHRACH